MDISLQTVLLSCLVVLAVARPQRASHGLQGQAAYAPKPAAAAPVSYAPQGSHQGNTGDANAYQLSNRVGPQGGGGYNPVPTHTQAGAYQSPAAAGYQGGGSGFQGSGSGFQGSGSGYQGGGSGYQGSGAGGQQSLAALGYRAPPSQGFAGQGGGSGGYQGNDRPGYRASGGIDFSGLSQKDVQSTLKGYDGTTYHGTIEPHNFQYAVDDAYYGNKHGHNEVSDGSKTQGEYRVLLPDGRTQVVTYTADATSGFMAKVSYEGDAKPYPAPDKVGGYQAQAQPSYSPGRSSYKPAASAFKPAVSQHNPYQGAQ